MDCSIRPNFPGNLLRLFPDGIRWNRFLRNHPLSKKRLNKMIRLANKAMNSSTVKGPDASRAVKSGVGIIFSVLTDHLLSEAHRLCLPQVMINKVVRSRRSARKSTNTEFKNRHTRSMRLGIADLIEAVLEKDRLGLDG